MRLPVQVKQGPAVPEAVSLGDDKILSIQLVPRQNDQLFGLVALEDGARELAPKRAGTASDQDNLGIKHGGRTGAE